MENVTIAKEKVLDYASEHGKLMFAVVVVLCIVIIAMYLNNCGWDIKVATGCKRKSKKSSLADNDEDLLDRLIESIREKQRR
jgi:hypothetical protein